MDNSKCAVLVPVARATEPETEDALRALAGRGYVVRVLRGCAAVDLARSTLATEVVMDGYEETIWIDADIQFDPDDVDRIRAHNLPFVVGLYVQKGPKRFAGMFPEDIGKVKFGKGGALVPMDDVGMGFTYVRAEVYRAIKANMPEAERSVLGGYQGKMITPYFLPLLRQKAYGLTYLSEDYSFTARAKEAGFPPVADTTIRLEHIGRKKYTWDDLVWSPERLESLEIQLGVCDWKFPASVRGWLTDEEGAGLVQLARDKDVLEVGSYCGRSSICLGQTAKSLCCVDPFDCRATPGEGNTFEEFAANLERFGVQAKVHRSVFAEAPLNGDRFDLVFIDAAHDEASVADDAARATALLRTGGLLAFHDARPQPGYHDGGWHPGVTLTVNRLIAAGAQMVQMVGTIAVLRPLVSPNRNEEIMIDQKALLTELESLERQHQEAQAQLNRVDGAAQVVRHLLAKETQGREAVARQAAEELTAARNGTPADGVPVQD